MEDVLTKKTFDGFSQLLREIEEERSATAGGGLGVSFVAASLHLHNAQNSNETESEKVKRLVKNVEKLCSKVDRRVVIRHRVTFWFGIALHTINLV